ncbi:hypothetical protein Tco_1207428, partial [Tanacetum coccineum]
DGGDDGDDDNGDSSRDDADGEDEEEEEEDEEEEEEHLAVETSNLMILRQKQELGRDSGLDGNMDELYYGMCMTNETTNPLQD